MGVFDSYSYTKADNPIFEKHREEFTKDWVEHYKIAGTHDGFPSFPLWLKLKGYEQKT